MHNAYTRYAHYTLTTVSQFDPFGDYTLAAHENRVSLQRRIWVELPGLVEEFRQALPVLELQSNAVVVEREFVGASAVRPALTWKLFIRGKAPKRVPLRHLLRQFGQCCIPPA
jgi:hypothetical protein